MAHSPLNSAMVDGLLTMDPHDSRLRIDGSRLTIHLFSCTLPAEQQAFMNFLRIAFSLGIIGIVVIAGLSCNNQKEDKKPKFPAESIYLDYRAWGDEESGMVTVRLQYRLGGPEGDPILLVSPSKVEWD